MPRLRHLLVVAAQASRSWATLSAVEAEALVNALRRWQSSFGLARLSTCRQAAVNVNDPFVRLILDRCLPSDVESQLCREPLDRLMQ